jgi:hypothetical protein
MIGSAVIAMKIINLRILLLNNMKSKAAMEAVGITS